MIRCENLSKRYLTEWIFRGLSMEFKAGGRYGIAGGNGSGKSTLMQILSGYLSPSQGSIAWGEAGQPIEREAFYARVGFCAPYIDLIEEFTLLEALRFHARFKPFAGGKTPEELLDHIGLPRRHNNKALVYFSSGMKQRVKIALALLSDNAVVLLDEPTITLDEAGKRWYADLLERHTSGRLLVIASNVAEDYALCPEVLSITDYKPKA